MIVVRNVFRLKFGHAKDALEAYKEVSGLAKQLTGGAMAMRVLTDVTGPFYTLVSELTFDSLSGLEQTMPKVSADPRWHAAYQKFTPHVESGFREILKIVE